MAFWHLGPRAQQLQPRLDFNFYTASGRQFPFLAHFGSGMEFGVDAGVGLDLRPYFHPTRKCFPPGSPQTRAVRSEQPWSPDLYDHKIGLGCLCCWILLWGGGGGHSFVACRSHLTIDHASISRRSTALTPNRDASNIWGLITFFPYVAYKLFACLIPFLVRRL